MGVFPKHKKFGSFWDKRNRWMRTNRSRRMEELGPNKRRKYSWEEKGKWIEQVEPSKELGWRRS